MPWTHGEQVITSSGALISSGKPVRVHNITWSSGATAGVVELYSGSSKTGTARWAEAGTANKTKTVNFNGGLLFSSGCYVYINAAATAAVIECSLEQ